MLIGGTKDVNVPIENNAIAFAQMTNAPSVYRADVIGATHTHFANICAIGDTLIDAGIEQSKWAAIGAEQLVDTYATTCTGDALPVGEAQRLQNLYATAFFRRHLLGEQGYASYLTESYAEKEPGVTFSAKLGPTGAAQ